MSSPERSAVVRADFTRWEVLADPTRRRLVDLLLTDGAASATRLAERVSVTRQAVQKQLSVLGDAGLVQSRRVGREVRFDIVPDQLEGAATEMAALAEGWEQRLHRLKDVAERLHGDDTVRHQDERP